MGATYLGQRSGDPTNVAIKYVKPSFPGSRSQIDDFLRSARILSKLDHPNIAHLHEVGVCAGGFYFVSEYVSGLNAGQVLKRDGPLAINRAVYWGHQMMQALEYAHGKHIIHHDIKPTNVVAAQIDGKEVVKLTDFALARVWQSAPFSGLSLTTAMINLASFIPPEILFNFQQINPLADQYSLAAVMYHLLTAADVLEMPKDERKRYSSLLSRQQVPLRERRSDVPAPLADLIQKALSRSPSLRFTDVAEFRAAMIQAVKGD
jgi:serine/threonine-protein kinase